MRIVYKYKGHLIDVEYVDEETMWFAYLEDDCGFKVYYKDVCCSDTFDDVKLKLETFIDRAISEDKTISELHLELE